MEKVWSDEGWENYIFLQENDRKLLKKVNNLLKDIERNGNTGIGKPEPLKGNLSGWYSREIDKKIASFIKLLTVAFTFSNAEIITMINITIDF